MTCLTGNLKGMTFTWTLYEIIIIIFLALFNTHVNAFIETSVFAKCSADKVTLNHDWNFKNLKDEKGLKIYDIFTHKLTFLPSVIWHFRFARGFALNNKFRLDFLERQHYKSAFWINIHVQLGVTASLYTRADNTIRKSSPSYCKISIRYLPNRNLNKMKASEIWTLLMKMNSLFWKTHLGISFFQSEKR